MPRTPRLLTPASGLLAVRCVTPRRPVLRAGAATVQRAGAAGGTGGRRRVCSRSTGWVSCDSAAQRRHTGPGWVSAAQVSQGTRVSSYARVRPDPGSEDPATRGGVAAARGAGGTTRQRSVTWPRARASSGGAVARPRWRPGGTRGRRCRPGRRRGTRSTSDLPGTVAAEGGSRRRTVGVSARSGVQMSPDRPAPFPRPALPGATRRAPHVDLLPPRGQGDSSRSTRSGDQEPPRVRRRRGTASRR